MLGGAVLSRERDHRADVLGLGPPVAGDTLDVFAIDFAGDHKRHGKRFSGSEHVRCSFGAASPEPDCTSHVALGSSLMVFHGSTLIAGTGRFLGATGRALSNKEVEGGSDVVARVTRRAT